MTDEARQRLAFWRGNAAAVHRELVEAARNGGPHREVGRARRSPLRRP